MENKRTEALHSAPARKPHKPHGQILILHATVFDLTGYHMDHSRNDKRILQGDAVVIHS